MGKFLYHICIQGIVNPTTIELGLNMPTFGEILFYIRFLRDPIGSLIRMHGENGAVTEYSRKGKPVVFMLGPKFNECILGDPETFQVMPITLPGAEGTAQRRIGQGLVNINGPMHRAHRRAVLPSLRGLPFRAYHDVAVESVDSLLAEWRSGETRDMAAEMSRLAIKVGSSALFAMKDASEGLAIAETIDHWFRKNTEMGVRLLRRDLVGTPYRRMARSAERVECAIRALIEQRRLLSAYGDDILSNLLKSGEETGSGLSDDELIGEVTILFIAAHETTSKSLTWTLFLLSQHPQIALDVVNEVDEVLNGDLPSGEQLARMPLLDNVIRESLRILPPVAFNVRRASRDIDVLGHALPKGAITVFSHYITHHMPEIYRHPELFMPARWNDISPTQYEYLPFSAGPRICIGAAFTMMVQKITLAMILQRFRFTVKPNATINRSTSVTVSSRDGLPMTLHNPDRNFRRVSVKGNIHEMVDLSGPSIH